MDKEEIRKLIREELYFMLKNDKFVFQLPIQIVDGKNIQTGRGVGTQIATDPTQKLGFYGVTPVTQQPAVTSPSGGATIDSQARYAIDYIRSNMISLGLFSS